MAPIFDKYATYYDALYKDKPYQLEADYIHNLIQSHSPEAKNILEFGSGTGKHAILLNSKGYEIDGVDQSESMLSQTQTAQGVNFHIGDIRSIHIDKQFDVVISLFHVMSYMNDDEDFIQVLSNAKKHLTSSGIFIFDVWYAPAVLNLKPETRTKRIDSSTIEILRITESEIDTLRSIVKVNFSVFLRDKSSGEIDYLEEDHSMRYFTSNEIKLLATIAGFEVIATEEFQTGNPLDDTTWGACFVLKLT